MTSTRRLGTAVVVLGGVLWLGGPGRESLAQDVKEVKKSSSKKSAPPQSFSPPASAPQEFVVTNFVPAVRFNFKIEPHTPLAELLPAPPKNPLNAQLYFGDDLTLIPEVAVQEPLAKSGKALEETAHTIAKINHVNKSKTDAFMEAMI